MVSMRKKAMVQKIPPSGLGNLHFGIRIYALYLKFAVSPPSEDRLIDKFQYIEKASNRKCSMNSFTCILFVIHRQIFGKPDPAQIQQLFKRFGWFSLKLMRIIVNSPKFLFGTYTNRQTVRCINLPYTTTITCFWFLT